MLSFNVKIRNRLRWMYVLTDFVSTNAAVFCYNIFRWYAKEETFETIGLYYSMSKVWGGQIFFPLLMMLVYWLSGYYNHVETRSRAQETITTLASAWIGSLTIFFLAVVNDFTWRRMLVFENLIVLAGLLFACVYIGRFLITRIEVKRIHSRHNFTDAMVMATDAQAVALANRINGLPKGMGVKVSFLLHSDDQPLAPGAENFEIIERADLEKLIQNRGLGMMIVSSGLPMMGGRFTGLLRLAVETDVPLFTSPDINSVALASNRSFNVLGEPLVCLSHPNISDSTSNIKRTVDVLGSIAALLLLSPLFLVTALAIKLDSRGPIFFRQTRLGRGAKPFRIYKFRSMVVNAEADGQARVTVDNDPRITRVGRLLRKYRIDEVPQFFNVIRGEMSLVGPRPERKHFAGQIAARVPLYPLIYQVRPGITSWGMVRFGYASTIDEMVERLRYDLIYLETISISTDLKILLHTFNTVFSGRGK